MTQIAVQERLDGSEVTGLEYVTGAECQAPKR